MIPYIDKSALVAEIERKKIPFKKDIDDGVYPTYLCALMDFEDFINTLEVKEINPTDAFIEKAWSWIEDNILSSNQQDKSLLYYEQFKKYLEE